jgi:protein-disulfide isomerase
VSRAGILVAVALLSSVGWVTLRSARNAVPPPKSAPAVKSASLAPIHSAPTRGATPDDPPVRTTSGRVSSSHDPDRPPALGPIPAKVTIVVYSDFTCGVCVRSAAATRQIVEEWPGEVRLELRSFAPPQHPHAENAAVASLAAHRQGRFWEMHDLLFANAGRLDDPNLIEYARTVGIDAERWSRDFADPALHRRVQEETEEASRLGASSTPTFFINGTVVVGWASWVVFRSQVEQELKAADELLAQGVPLSDVHALRARAAAKSEAGFETYRAAVIAGRSTPSAP